MFNGIFKLYSNDFVKGLVMAVIGAVLVALYGVVFVEKFDVFSVNWTILSHNMINGAVVAFFSYLAKNLFSTNKGSFLNVTPDDKKISD